MRQGWLFGDRRTTEVVQMRKAALLTVIVMMVGLTGVMAAAQCDCNTVPEGEGPSCYTSYWAGVDVEFKLVVAAEYFWCCPTCATPLITGWRVETLDGTIVYQEQFPDVPKGHYLEMVWDQRDTWCNRVPPGYYRLVIQTTSAGEFENYVQIVPRPGYWGWCNCCCPQLYSCPCCPTFGDPYVQIARCMNYGTAWGSISVTVHIGIGCGCP